jgi:hypothetical protein
MPHKILEKDTSGNYFFFVDCKENLLKFEVVFKCARFFDYAISGPIIYTNTLFTRVDIA